ncbi:MAG TPA: ABC transporter ATP-binding protein [Thermoanaerobaculia bacterium]|nr:ABC transporter ATP-binding protein [Thermoanaerobaculia bacterium]
MSGGTVSASRLTKTYRVFESPWQRLWEALTGRRLHRPFHALHDVSFELEPGEAFGVLGENGAGKSTLLKLVAGVLEPTSGEVKVSGKVASILELGSGFHPEFSGRQNLLLNAAALGLSRREALDKLPRIVEFSELGPAIDQPLKSYSTGMAMRLAFSIATQVEPDVLIVDEALSVGDGYFQKKSMDRMNELVRGGTALLFCSHAMYYVSTFCERALWLCHGRVERLGAARDVIAEYERYLLEKSAPPSAAGTVTAEEAAVSPGPARLTAVTICPQRADRDACRPGEPWALLVEWECDDPRLAFHLGVGVNRVEGIEVFSCVSIGAPGFPVTGARRYRVVLEVPRLPLVKGDFDVYVHLADENGLHVYDRECLSPGFSVRGEEYSFGLVQVEHAFTIEKVSAADRRAAS